MNKGLALVCSEITDDLSGVQINEIETEDPTGNEVLIRVKAASVNFPDLLMTQGKYQHKPELPFILGMEGSGVILKTGDLVKELKEGDEVTFGSWGTGAFSEFIKVPEQGVKLKPKSLDFAQAASFQTAYLTAYVSLVRRGYLNKGESVLVHGATGGVGMAAVQLAKYLDAKVIATGTSLDKLEETRSWGADHIVLTHKEDGVAFREEVKDLTEGKGADVIYDPVGGDVFDESIRCINWGGRLLIVGFASGRIPTAPVNMPLIKGFSIIGVRAGEYGRRDPVKGEENNQAIREIAETGAFKPHICKKFSLAESKEAIVFLEQRKLLGKVAIVMD
tara:strand:- start:224 stop:1225 length:1002 start_codon:yes stop_codon:yes gene_type:complete